MTASRRAPEIAPLASPAAGFTERVMSAVASSPAPSAARSFVVAARERKIGDATAALAVAWHLALRSRVPMLVRLQAAGLVAVVALSAGAGTVAVAAAAQHVAAPIVGIIMDAGSSDDRPVPPVIQSPTAPPLPGRVPVAADPGPDETDDDADALDAYEAGPRTPALLDADKVGDGQEAEGLEQEEGTGDAGDPDAAEDASDQPGATEVPDTSDEPEGTDQPGATEVPDTSDEPDGTDMPEGD